MRKRMNKKEREKILVKIFIIWFVISIISILIIPGKYQIMIFGQYFTIFGMIILNQEEDKKLGLPFVTIGIFCIIIPICMMHPEIFSFTIVWENVIPLLIMIGVVLGGIGAIYFPRRKDKYLK